MKESQSVSITILIKAIRALPSDDPQLKDSCETPNEPGRLYYE